MYIIVYAYFKYPIWNDFIYFFLELRLSAKTYFSAYVSCFPYSEHYNIKNSLIVYTKCS